MNSEWQWLVEFALLYLGFSFGWNLVKTIVSIFKGE